MPHKVTTVGLVDEVTPTARIAGAVKRHLGLHDASAASADSLAHRLCAHDGELDVTTGSDDPAG